MGTMAYRATLDQRPAAPILTAGNPIAFEGEWQGEPRGSSVDRQ
jgi:hypothetical protein